MKGALAFLLRIYAGLTALGTALLAVAAAALFASGALSGARVGEALRVLREGAPAPLAPRREPGEEARRAAAETLARRQEEVRRLEARLAARVVALEADRARLEEGRGRLAAEEARFRRERESAGPSAEDDAVASILPVFSRMEGAEAAEVMRDWDDARIVAALRALRPSKAAELLSALRTDPRFERDFRRTPEGAPPGAKTRLERIFESLQDGRPAGEARSAGGPDRPK